MTGHFCGSWMLMVTFLLSSEVYCPTFERSICLEVVDEFFSKENRCRIQLDKVKQWLSDRSGTSMCRTQTFCKISFVYYSSDEEQHYQFENTRITIVNGFSGESTTMTPYLDCSGYSYRRKMILNINMYGGCLHDNECGENEKCLMYNGALRGISICFCNEDTLRINGICRKVDVELGDSCKEDIQCNKAGNNRVCNKTTSSCLCADGFTEVNGHCMKTGLEVDQKCWYDEQCNGTANSNVCRRNMCACMAEHYYADGACQPSKGTDVENTQRQQLLQENKDFTIVHIVAAVIGGFVIGILVCFAAIYVLKIRSRRNKEDRNTEVKVVNNERM